MNEIILKRIYDPAGETDGFRIFVDRLWARGVKKEDARFDLWAKEISPSAELRKYFAHKAENFEKFRLLYFKELDENPYSKQFLDTVNQKLKSQNVSFVFAAKDAQHSNAAVLKEWTDKNRNK